MKDETIFYFVASIVITFLLTAIFFQSVYHKKLEQIDKELEVIYLDMIR